MRKVLIRVRGPRCVRCLDRGWYGRRSRGYVGGWRKEICACAAGKKLYPPGVAP